MFYQQPDLHKYHPSPQYGVSYMYQLLCTSTMFRNFSTIYNGCRIKGLFSFLDDIPEHGAHAPQPVYWPVDFFFLAGLVSVGVIIAQWDNLTSRRLMLIMVPGFVAICLIGTINLEAGRLVKCVSRQLGSDHIGHANVFFAASVGALAGAMIIFSWLLGWSNIWSDKYGDCDGDDETRPPSPEYEYAGPPWSPGIPIPRHDGSHGDDRRKPCWHGIYGGYGTIHQIKRRERVKRKAEQETENQQEDGQEQEQEPAQIEDQAQDEEQGLYAAPSLHRQEQEDGDEEYFGNGEGSSSWWSGNRDRRPNSPEEEEEERERDLRPRKSRWRTLSPF